MALLSNGNGRFVAGFALGLGVGLLAPKIAPALGRSVRPVTRAALKGAILAWERGREWVARFGESVEDLLAEVQDELAREAEADDAAEAGSGPEEAGSAAEEAGRRWRPRPVPDPAPGDDAGAEA